MTILKNYFEQYILALFLIVIFFILLPVYIEKDSQPRVLYSNWYYVDGLVAQGIFGELEEVIFDSRTIGIGGSAFSNASFIKHVEIHNNITFIGQDAFRNCTLKNIYIPSSVKTIQTNAFQGCEYLTIYTSFNSADELPESWYFRYRSGGQYFTYKFINIVYGYSRDEYEMIKDDKLN